MLKIKLVISCMLVSVIFQSSFINAKHFGGSNPKAMLIPSKKFSFNSFVDCNMAEAWIGDTFRIFPGKYGEDPVWGEAHDLKFASGKNADETFGAGKEAFANPV